MGDSTTLLSESTAKQGTDSEIEVIEDTDDVLADEGEQRNVRAKLSHPSSPRSSPDPTSRYNTFGPPKLRVVVRDVAYSTYLAVLYYASPLLLNTLAFR